MENDVLYNRIMKKVTEMIAEAGGGSSLPAVTADDNGDVLTVVSGEWAKAEPGSSTILINFSDIGDYSYNDIMGYINAGKLVVLVNVTDPDINEIYYAYLTYTIPSDISIDEPAYVVFHEVDDGNLIQLSFQSQSPSDDSPLVYVTP